MINNDIGINTTEMNISIWVGCINARTHDQMGRNGKSTRKKIWESYYEGLKSLSDSGIMIPFIPDYATNNGHMFYLVCSSIQQRTSLIEYLKNNEIHAVFHYQSLHKSTYYINKHDKREIPFSDKYTDCLVRLPLFYELSDTDLNRIIDIVKEFFIKYE